MRAPAARIGGAETRNAKRAASSYLPDLLGPLGGGIRGQVLAGSVAAFLTATVAVRVLLRWFRTRSLRPFGLYCLLFGLACIAVFA